MRFLLSMWMSCFHRLAQKQLLLKKCHWTFCSQFRSHTVSLKPKSHKNSSRIAKHSTPLLATGADDKFTSLAWFWTSQSLTSHWQHNLTWDCRDELSIFGEQCVCCLLCASHTAEPCRKCLTLFVATLVHCSCMSLTFVHQCTICHCCGCLGVFRVCCHGKTAGSQQTVVVVSRLDHTLHASIFWTFCWSGIVRWFECDPADCLCTIDPAWVCGERVSSFVEPDTCKVFGHCLCSMVQALDHAIAASVLCCLLCRTTSKFTLPQRSCIEESDTEFGWFCFCSGELGGCRFDRSGSFLTTATSWLFR